MEYHESAWLALQGLDLRMELCFHVWMILGFGAEHIFPQTQTWRFIALNQAYELFMDYELSFRLDTFVLGLFIE